MTADELTKAWFENVWNQRSDDFVHQHLGSPCEIKGLPPSTQTPEGFIAFRDQLISAIPDMHIEVLESLCEGDRSIGTCRVTGTHQASKNAVDFCFAYTARVEDDKIVAAHNIVDFLTMLQQTEAVPPSRLAETLGI